MGTRSVVFARTESGLKGVYVHFDGYPDGRLPLLRTLIKRDGVDTVVRTILGKPSGWSHLNADQSSVLEKYLEDGRFLAIPGYGVQYNDQPVETPWSDTPVVQGELKYRTPEDVFGDPFIEYVYVIEEDGSISWAENDYTRPWRHQRWRISRPDVEAVS